MVNSNLTQQEETWLNKFGKDYTNRTMLSLTELKQYYINNYGMSKEKLNKEFLDKCNIIHNSDKILEVGCGNGDQLLLLQDMGYTNLWGIELQENATNIAKARICNANVINGSVFDIPYKDNYFYLVFTTGLLIHISPNDINKALDEIYRCSKKYIWGFEYYSPTLESIKYRGQDNLCWKANYAQMFLDRFSDLKLAHKKFVPYLHNNNVDCMYLLEKV